MDGENKGSNPIKMDALGGPIPIFGSTPIWKNAPEIQRKERHGFAGYKPLFFIPVINMEL